MRRKLKALGLALFTTWFVVVFFTGVRTGAHITKWFSELPLFDSFEYYRPLQTTYFYDKEKNIIGCAALEWRDALSVKEVRNLPIADIIVGMEDERFFERDWPIDLWAIGRALVKNYNAGRVVEGGSTIQQQLVKQLLSPEERKERSIMRKLKELVLGFRLLGSFTKDEILTLYLNEVYLGHNRYGVEAASLFYFGKRASRLSLTEAATLTGMIHSPATLSPYNHPDRAKERRNIVLRRMHELNKIDVETYLSARDEPIVTSRAFWATCHKEPYVTRFARRELNRRYRLLFDNNQRNTMWRGLRVYTTLDPDMQHLALGSIRNALSLYKMRQKEKAVDANAAMIVLDNTTGAVRAMIGSRDENETQFNHATQAHRQSGSSFKPIVYSSYFTKLIEKEGVESEKILDRRISNARFSCRGATRRQRWSPKNYDERKMSAASYKIRYAIEHSTNRCVLHAAMSAPCTLDLNVVITARHMGIESKLGSMERNALRFRLPLALGAADLTLLELTRAYMVFPNSGAFMPEHIIDRITGADDMPIFQFVNPEVSPALRDDVANLMVEVLRGVTTRGTAASMKAIKQPTAGKTGTTNDYTDALFIGFTPSLTIGTWIGGKDKTVSLGDRETGGKTALPAFKEFVSTWYANQPIEEFPPLNMCRNLERQ